MFKRVATPPAVVSAEHMFRFFARRFIVENPEYKTKTWKYYIEQGEVVHISTKKSYRNYRQFKTILAAINKEVGKKLIAGYAFDLGNGLGNLFAARIERPTNYKKLDYRKSATLKKKLEEEGKLTETNWKVPYIDDDFIGIIWHKGNKLVRNIHLYKFKTAKGETGKSFRSLFSKANINNPSLKALYPFLPSKKLEMGNA